MKFNTTHTKGGYKILSLHGPDECEEFAGIVDTGGSYLTITWYDTGVPISANELYSLIPLDEPKPDHKIEAWLEVLEGRLEALEHDNKEYNTWGVRVNGDLHELHNRILRLEQKTADTSDYHNLRLQIQDVEKQLEALEQDVKNSEEWGEHVNSDLSQLVLQVRALEQRTKTGEKGVWVTTKTFWDACWSQVSVKGEPLEDLFERMAKQLGLEE